MSTSGAPPAGNAPRLRLVLHRQAESDSDSDSDSQPARETYSTYSELRSRDIMPYPTLDAVRLVWSFSGGPLETSLSVMAEAYNIDVLEPYFQQTAGGGPGSGSPWHVVSKSPLTHPPVSEIAAAVDDFELWESDWLEFHENHSDPDSYTESDILKYGTLPDYDPQNDRDPPHLLKCCGTDRPRGKKGGVLVTASPSGPGFVTIHEYITTVHPWLLRNRDDILKAMDRWEQMPDLEDKDLVVDLVQPKTLTIKERSEWVRELSMRRPSWMTIHERETSDISYPV